GVRALRLKFPVSLSEVFVGGADLGPRPRDLVLLPAALAVKPNAVDVGERERPLAGRPEVGLRLKFLGYDEPLPPASVGRLGPAVRFQRRTLLPLPGEIRLDLLLRLGDQVREGE